METLFAIAAAGVIGLLVLLAIFRPSVLTSIFGAVGDLIETGVNTLLGRTAVHRIQGAINRENRKLAASVGDIENVKADIKTIELRIAESIADEKRAAVRLNQCIDAKDDAGKKEYSTAIARLRKDRAVDQADLADLQNQYNQIIDTVNNSMKNIEDAKRDAGRDAARLRTASVRANASDLARRLNVSFGADGDISTLRNQIKQQTIQKEAKADVANDLMAPSKRERAYQDAEQAADAGNVLAEFEKNRQ